MVYIRLKAFGGWCIGILGSFLRHPKTVGLVMRVLGGLLVWVMKIFIVVLLSNIGVTVPVF
jgi:hypothetical protein